MRHRPNLAIGFSLLLALPLAAGAADISYLSSEVIRTATEYRDQLVLQQKLEDLEVYRRPRGHAGEGLYLEIGIRAEQDGARARAGETRRYAAADQGRRDDHRRGGGAREARVAAAAACRGLQRGRRPGSF